MTAIQFQFLFTNILTEHYLTRHTEWSSAYSFNKNQYNIISSFYIQFNSANNDTVTLFQCYKRQNLYLPL